MDWTSPIVATTVLIVWIFLVFIVGCYLGIFNDKTLRIGPAKEGENQIKIFGFEIDTMKKVMCVIIYSFLSRMVTEYGDNIISPWITNVIQDPKVTTLPMSKLWILLIHNGYNIFGWLNYIIQIMMVFTMELQFILPKIVASLIIGNVTTWNYISNKIVS